ncbi:MAG: DEAD/DEAH box helicase [Clostridiaceae bacterium]|nr:DEAD/DEAH box helicase [Clostridiaceae bacterium]
MPTNALELFDPLTACWFSRAIGVPTAVQEAAWPAIAAGGDTLVSAPTGTGKTLSAFLVFIDRLKAQARGGTLKNELQLIYISPLKSLAGDIRENLRRPLDGISEEERKTGAGFLPPSLNIAIRTGDTPQNERRKMIKTPPHILITTPESLYLMLTSKSGQSILRTARWIIVDELHALIDTKRGAHLMLSIARLDRLCPGPLQRIGLSATIEPLDKAAEYLSPAPVTIVAPKMHKAVQLVVTSPLSGKRIVQKDSVWQELAGSVFEHCKGARSVIAFVEGRAYAEKLAYYVNQIAGDGFARTHHGSLSKEQRFDVEHALRSGNLRLLCATSSMELGIDVGDIDQVFQIGCPRSISSTMQRLGRAGHNPDRVSVMHIFPRAASEGLYSGLAAEVVRNGGIEYSHPPRLCLDVLAQHLVSMAAGDGYDVGGIMALLPRAYPFREVTPDDVRGVLRMLAGDYEHDRDIPARPRILYDRIHDRVEGDPYSRMLAISAGGTIPDKGLYAVRTEKGVKLGELDEEYVFEARVGDKFLLGSFAWQISGILKDTVVVAQSTPNGARPPFWKGDIRGRRIQTGLAYGAILRKLGSAYEAGTLLQELSRLGLDDTAAESAQDFLKRQLIATGILPDDRTILAEHFCDETGNHQLMVHSVFGRPVNEPLAILAAETAKRQTNTDISYVVDDDGFLLFPYGNCALPQDLLQAIPPDSADSVLAALLPATPLFNMTFRYNAARALMMGVRKTGRQPLWIQRLRSAEMLDSIIKYKDHPLIRETRRECLEDIWDLPAARQILKQLQSGAIQVRELFLDMPSPMSLPLRQQTEAAMMYDYAPMTSGIHRAVEAELNQTQMIAPAPEQLARVSERTHLPENENQLHVLLMIEGDLTAGELDVPIEWLEKLARQEQAKYIEPGLWIAAEQDDEYAAALTDGKEEAQLRLVRRLLRYRGAHTPDQVGERYLWPEQLAQELLETLCRQKIAVESGGLYYHAELYDRARRETVKNRRRQIRTLPPERYAALLAGRVRITAPSEEKLDLALRALSGLPYPPELWESALLPVRVTGYRPELMDTLLSQGNLFWRITPGAGLSFHLYEDIDWDSDLSTSGSALDGHEKIIYEALLKRGASFMHRLTDLLDGAPPYDVLWQLAEKGLAYADSFVPVRQWLKKEKIESSSVKQRVKARVMALTSGRWELSRPLKALSPEQQLERLFDRVVILSRETVQGMSWGAALNVLRVWEYTGRVRRGYFIGGLSGIQFIREKDYAGTMLSLEQPRDQIICLPAVDPAQPWGKCLPHWPERSFLNVPGTVVALRAGVPVAVFERQGKTLRVFDEASLPEVLHVIAYDYSERRLYPAQNRLTVRQYPPEAADALVKAGFIREMQDYVLYREYR